MRLNISAALTPWTFYIRVGGGAVGSVGGYNGGIDGGSSTAYTGGGGGASEFGRNKNKTAGDYKPYIIAG